MYSLLPLYVSFIYKVPMVISRNAKGIFALLKIALFGRARRIEEKVLFGYYIVSIILWRL